MADATHPETPEPNAPQRRDGRRGRNGIDAIDVRPLRDGYVELLVRPLRPLRPDFTITRANVRIARRSGGGMLALAKPPSVVRLTRPYEGGTFGLSAVVRDPLDGLAYTLRLVAADPDGHATGAPLPGFDPLYSMAEFRFRDDCVPAGDCDAEGPCAGDASRVAAPLEVDYLAKDYASFRRLMLDRMAQTTPEWTDRNPADLGVTIIEALAYDADHLSYYQDAVATEAYLSTARRRMSVRRHVRLVDYPMHEGCNARAWVHVKVKHDLSIRPEEIYFFTDPARDDMLGRPRIDRARDLLADSESDRVVFMPIIPRHWFRAIPKELPDGPIPAHAAAPHESAPIQFHAAHNQITLHVAGDGEACLPRGATSATLVSDPGRPLKLRCGDLLLFEEITGPKTSTAADADPRRRHVVRLTRVEAGPEFVDVEWFEEDALPFPLCLQGGRGKEVSVARGNIVLVDQGIWRPAEPVVPIRTSDVWPSRSDRQMGAWRYQPLQAFPLTHAAPFPDPVVAAAVQAAHLDERRSQAEARRPRPPCPRRRAETRWLHSLIERARACGVLGPDLARWALGVTRPLEPDAHSGTKPPQPVGTDESDCLARLELGPAAVALRQRPQAAMPDLVVVSDQTPRHWEPRRDLLGHAGEARQVVAEIDDEGLAHLRFDEETPGQAPPPGQTLSAFARVGNGAAGNVGAGAIRRWIGLNGELAGIETVSNPLPAAGGTDPEPIDSVKLLAPTALRDDLLRAIIADDYAAIAGRDPRVQRSRARLLWTGAGFEARVALDLKADTLARYGGRVERVYREIEALLKRLRRVGHDVRVVPARLVPLDVALAVRLAPHALPMPVERALHLRLGPRVGPDGRRGFFHPDNLTFGQEIAVSALVAAAAAVEGVASVRVLRLARLDARLDRAGGLDPPCNGVGTTAETVDFPDLVLALGRDEVPRLDDEPERPTRGRLTICFDCREALP